MKYDNDMPLNIKCRMKLFMDWVQVGAFLFGVKIGGLERMPNKRK
jgi:hypothetical protein